MSKFTGSSGSSGKRNGGNISNNRSTPFDKDEEIPIAVAVAVPIPEFPSGPLPPRGKRSDGINQSHTQTAGPSAVSRSHLPQSEQHHQPRLANNNPRGPVPTHTIVQGDINGPAYYPHHDTNSGSSAPRQFHNPHHNKSHHIPHQVQPRPQGSVANAAPQPSTVIDKTTVCRHFSKGHCNLGSKCGFLHVVPTNHPQTHGHQVPASGGATHHANGKAADKKKSKINQHEKADVVNSDNESHSSAESLPPCKFFQEDKCTNKNCKYPHVKATHSKQVTTRTKLDSSERTDMESVVNDLQRTVHFLNEEERKALSLDLVIVMDCTASMDSWIHAAKEQVHSIIAQVQSRFGQKATIRVGFVAYRDYDVPKIRISSKALTENLAEVRSFIAGEKATGGDDSPEDIPGGFQAALGMDWNANAKLLILVTDAPCHGSRYHDFRPDNDTQGRPTDPNIEEQMREMARRGIGFAMIDIKPRNTKIMVPLLRAAYESEVQMQQGNVSKNKKKVGMHNALTFTVIPFQLQGGSSSEVDAAATDLLTMTLVNCCTNSLEASVTQSIESLKRLSRQRDRSLLSKTATLSIHQEVDEEEESSDEEIIPASSLPKTHLQWDILEHMHSENAVRYTYWLNIKDVPLNVWTSDPLNPKYLTLNKQRTTIRVMRSFFNEGAMRTAHGLQDEHISQHLVAKVYKKPSDRQVKNYQMDAQIQTIAKGLAKEFSKHPQSLAAIDFISVSYYELLDRRDDDQFKYFAAEPYMTGSYVKYINNGGFVAHPASSVVPPQQEEVSKIAQAFSHFSWQHTSARLHVVDLQGVDNILTDPQIHSKQGGGMLGKGDIGHWGSAMFFRTHICNDYCRALALRHPAFPSTAGVAAIIPAGRKGAAGATQVQLCCELYCGTVFTSSREDYLSELESGREIYCAQCNQAKRVTESRKCEKCSETFQLQSFWYRMKGMEAPKECSQCREKGKKDKK